MLFKEWVWTWIILYADRFSVPIHLACGTAFFMKLGENARSSVWMTMNRFFSHFFLFTLLLFGPRCYELYFCGLAVIFHSVVTSALSRRFTYIFFRTADDCVKGSKHPGSTLHSYDWWQAKNKVGQKLVAELAWPQNPRICTKKKKCHCQECMRRCLKENEFIYPQNFMHQTVEHVLEFARGIRQKYSMWNTLIFIVSLFFYSIYIDWSGWLASRVEQEEYFPVFSFSLLIS